MSHLATGYLKFIPASLDHRATCFYLPNGFECVVGIIYAFAAATSSIFGGPEFCMLHEPMRFMHF